MNMDRIAAVARLLICAAVILCAAHLSADNVTRKDGTTVTGKILSDDGESITIQTSDGTVTIERAQISSVEKSLRARADDRPRSSRRSAEAEPAASEETSDEDDEEKQKLVDQILTDTLSLKGKEKEELVNRLLKMGDDVSPYLYCSFCDAPSREMGREALRVLSKVKGPVALDALYEIVNDYSLNPKWRREMVLFAKELTKAADPATVPALVRLTRLPDRVIRGRAMTTLRRIRKKDPESGAIREAVVCEIERTRTKGEGDESELVTMVTLLGDAGDGTTPEVLMDLARSGTPALRSASISALAKLFPQVADSMKEMDRERALKRIRRALRDRSRRVKTEAARSLGTVGDRSAISDLIDLLDDRSPVVQQAAREALTELAGMDLGSNYEVWQFWWDKQRKEPVE